MHFLPQLELKLIDVESLGFHERLYLEKNTIICTATMRETGTRSAKFGRGLLLGYFALFVIY